MLNQYSWLIPLLPLIPAVLIICGLSRNRLASAITSIGAVGISFLYSLVLLVQALIEHSKAHYEVNFAWLKVGAFQFDFGILLDPLGLTMLLVVTSVSCLVQIYSMGYMQEDAGFSKFFAFLSLFTASMLGLVISTNLFQTFIFWELVGLCSYLLIGFWHAKEAAGNASMKAFVVNRVGDCGLLLGILLLAMVTVGFWPNGAFLGFSSLNEVVNQLVVNKSLPVIGLISLSTIALLMLLGPMSKSAQFPLHIWLPDAMEGPTPISALIHAATMVAAGVFLLARLFPLFEAAPFALHAVAVIGAITALFAATIALSQNDIKKALAYSTCSQLGYMVMSIGLGNWIAGIFHLFTHAFFKALLFLGSGSVIHACHHEQDMREYGGLAKFMPATAKTFLIGTMAIAGVPGLAGFWSKERIIASAGGFASPIYWIATITAGLTAFYMFRIYFMTFSGKYRGHAKPHESPITITFPLLKLAGLSIFAGFLGTHLKLLGGDHFGHFLDAHQAHHNLTLQEFWHELLTPAALTPLLMSGIGILAAYLIYNQGSLKINEFIKQNLKPIHALSQNKWYIDEIYGFFVQKIILPIFYGSWKLIDTYLIDGVFNAGLINLAKISGWLLAGSGRIQTYIGIFALVFTCFAVLVLGTGMSLELQINMLAMQQAFELMQQAK